MSGARGAGLRAGVGRVLLVAIVVSALASVVWYRRVSQEPGPPGPAPEGPETGAAEMVLRDFRHAETRMDRTIWVLEAKRAEVEGDVAKLRTVKITWYGADPRQLPVVITSRSGQVNLRSSNASLRGKVRVVRSDGAALATSRLLWNNRARQLRAPYPVTIRAQGLRFRGRSMVADVERQSVRLAGAVTGTIGGAAAARAGGR